MDFLGSLHMDVKLLLVAGALALLAGLVSGSKRNEYRYMAVFALVMAVAGVRFQQEQAQDLAADSATRTDVAAKDVLKAGSARSRRQ